MQFAYTICIALYALLIAARHWNFQPSYRVCSFVSNWSIASRIKLHVIQWNVMYLMTSNIRQYITGYMVANCWCYPIRSCISKLSAMELILIAIVRCILLITLPNTTDSGKIIISFLKKMILIDRKNMKHIALLHMLTWQPYKLPSYTAS